MVDFQVINGQPLFIVNEMVYSAFCSAICFFPRGVLFEWQNGPENLSNPGIVIGPLDPRYPELRYRPASLKLAAGGGGWTQASELGSDLEERGEEGGGHMGLHPTCWDEK